MKKIVLTLILALSIGVFYSNNTFAEDLPYQISILSPIQTSPPNSNIRGYRFNLIYGVSENMSGIDNGLFNTVNGTQKGLQFGFFNSAFKAEGIQIGFFNKAEYLEGIQIGLLNFHTEGNFKILPIVNWAF